LRNNSDHLVTIKNENGAKTAVWQCEEMTLPPEVATVLSAERVAAFLTFFDHNPS
jgi:hypothetical protein